MWEKLGQYFSGRGFHEVNLNRSDMRLFYASEGKSADPILMIADAAVAELSREQYLGYLEKIRGIFLRQGFETVSMLTLFVTSRIERCREIGEETAFWIVDGEYGRLIVYENQPEDFLGIRTVIDNNLHFGGHSRNAEGAQTDLNHSNLNIQAYREEADRQRRLRASRRHARFQNVCVVTYGLIVVNAIIFLLTDLFEITSILQGGWMSWKTAFGDHEYWRLFTCMFLHFGIDHIGGNMIALFVFGEILERHMGRSRYLILYLVSGLGASVISCVFYHFLTDMDPYSVGASGAIYGLMGAMVAMLIKHRDLRSRDYGMRLGVFVAYLAYTFLRGDTAVNHAAHFGGMVCGVILYLILDAVKTARGHDWQRKLRD